MNLPTSDDSPSTQRDALRACGDVRAPDAPWGV
jgi:hypothetical protein